MRVRSNAVWFGWITLLCSTGASVAAQPRDPETAAEDLQQISKELTEATSLLQTQLEQAVASFDRGSSRGPNQTLAADFEIASGESAALRRKVTRKLLAARMLAVRGTEYDPPVLRSLDHLQSLITEARKRVDAGDERLQRLLVVSIGSLNRQETATWKTQHQMLVKARSNAEQAMQKAFVEMPFDLPEADSNRESQERAWNLLVFSRPKLSSSDPLPEVPVAKAPPVKSDRLVFLHWERKKRVTLVRESGYRAALTDPGTIDRQGRHLFLEEEWSERGAMVVRKRWRVAVDPATGQHTLVKSYPVVQRRGNVAEAYAAREADYLWTLEPPDESLEPSKGEVDSALADVTSESNSLGIAIQEYQKAVSAALARNDRLQAAENQAPPDAELAQELRAKLFTIRGHLVRTPVDQEAQSKLQSAVNALSARVTRLEQLASWANRSGTPTEPTTSLPAATWDLLQSEADAAIYRASQMKMRAGSALPPDLSPAQAKFPALQDDMIVRIVRQPLGQGTPASTLQCLQEVWRLLPPVRPGSDARVERLVSLILIDSHGDRQRLVKREIRVYKVGPDQALEGIFDQYGSQEPVLVSAQ